MGDEDEERAYQVAALRAVAAMIQSGLVRPLRRETIESMFLEAAELAEADDDASPTD